MFMLCSIIYSLAVVTLNWLQPTVQHVHHNNNNPLSGPGTDFKAGDA